MRQLIRQRLKELLNGYVKRVLHYIFLHITFRSITNMHIYSHVLYLNSDHRKKLNYMEGKL